MGEGGIKNSQKNSDIFYGRPLNKLPQGPSIKDVEIILAIFDTPFPHVGISTLIYQTPTF